MAAQGAAVAPGRDLVCAWQQLLTDSREACQEGRETLGTSAVVTFSLLSTRLTHGRTHSRVWLQWPFPVWAGRRGQLWPHPRVCQLSKAENTSSLAFTEMCRSLCQGSKRRLLLPSLVWPCVQWG